MTVVCGIVRDKYAILASDTRITYFHEDGKSSFSDDAVKMHFFGGGWVAGSGSSLFVNNFNNMMCNTAFSNVDTFNEVYQELLQMTLSEGEAILPSNRQLGVMAYTFGYTDDSYINRLHLEVLNPLRGRLGISGEDTFTSFAQRPDQDTIVNDYKELLSTRFDLNDTLCLVAGYIQSISETNAYVSSICDIGILEFNEDRSELRASRIRDYSKNIMYIKDTKSLARLVKVLKG